MCENEKASETLYVNDIHSLTLAKNGDAAALEKIVTTNLGLVKGIAKRFIGRGCEYEDLVQIGTVGMIKAIYGFDTSKNCRFTTYAVPLIMGEIKRHLRDDGWIKISRDAKQNAASVFRFTDEYIKKNGMEPTVDEVSLGTGIAKEDIAFALESSRPALSLYDKDEETGFSPENTVGVDSLGEKITGIALKECIDKLSPEEKKLVILRYFRGMTQESAAVFLGYSQVKVSREEKKILRKLRLLLG